MPGTKDIDLFESVGMMIAAKNYFVVFGKLRAGQRGIHLFKQDDNKFLRTMAHPSEGYIYYYHLAFSSDGKNILACRHTGDIDVFSIESGKLAKTYKGIAGRSTSVSRVFELSGDRLLVNAGDNIRIYNAAGVVVGEICNYGDTIKTSLSPCQKILTYTDNHAEGVILYDVESCIKLRAVKDTFPVICAEISPDSQWLVYGGMGEVVKFFNLKTTEERILVTGAAEVHCLLFSKNNRYLVIGDYKRGFSIFDFEKRDIVFSNFEIGKYVSHIAFRDNETIIVATHEKVFAVELPPEIQAGLLAPATAATSGHLTDLFMPADGEGVVSAAGARSAPAPL